MYNGEQTKPPIRTFPYVNEVTLREQKPPLKCCQPFDLLTQLKRELDLLMLKIWRLQVKGLQNYRPSNFENDWTATGGSNPSRLADWGRTLFGTSRNHSKSLVGSFWLQMAPFQLQMAPFQLQLAPILRPQHPSLCVIGCKRHFSSQKPN